MSSRPRRERHRHLDELVAAEHGEPQRAPGPRSQSRSQSARAIHAEAVLGHELVLGVEARPRARAPLPHRRDRELRPRGELDPSQPGAGLSSSFFAGEPPLSSNACAGRRRSPRPDRRDRGRAARCRARADRRTGAPLGAEELRRAPRRRPPARRPPRTARTAPAGARRATSLPAAARGRARARRARPSGSTRSCCSRCSRPAGSASPTRGSSPPRRSSFARPASARAASAPGRAPCAGSGRVEDAGARARALVVGGRPLEPPEEAACTARARSRTARAPRAAAASRSRGGRTRARRARASPRRSRGKNRIRPTFSVVERACSRPPRRLSVRWRMKR